MIYFIDGRYGSDLNDGLSRQTAFATVERISDITLDGGDSVLIKADTVYSGSLHLKRNRDGGIIKIDRYGTGENPVINGNGKSPVLLENFDFVEIKNIGVTNPNGEMGIQILAKVPGEYSHIHISGCRVNNVNVDRKSYCHECGGIIVCAWSDEPSWFNGLLIEDNVIEDVARSGIMLSSPWVVRPDGLWGKNSYIDDENGWFPSKNVVVRGNYLNRLGGDGILLEGTVGALVEWNKVFNIMTNPVPPCANAGIWPVNSNDCLIQYNEVGFSHKPEDCSDAQGYDVDSSCRNTVVQYNYSHDNEGGFILLCEVEGIGNEEFKGTVVRNNLSVNDGTEKGELIALVGSVREARVENNRFLVSDKIERLVEVYSNDGTDQAKNITVKSNDFIYAGKNGIETHHNLCNGENIVIEDNRYIGIKHCPAKGETVAAERQTAVFTEKNVLFERLINSK